MRPRPSGLPCAPPLSAWRKHRRWLIGQVALWGILALLLRVAVVPAETCPPVDAGAVAQAADAGGDWLARGQRRRPFLYGYYSDRDRVSSDCTTRHAGVMAALYALGRIGAADAALGHVPRGPDLAAWLDRLRAARRVGRRRRQLAPRRRADESAQGHRGQRRYDRLRAADRPLPRLPAAARRQHPPVLPAVREAGPPGVYGKFATGEAFAPWPCWSGRFPRRAGTNPPTEVADYLATRRDEVEGGFREPDHWAAYEARGAGTLRADRDRSRVRALARGLLRLPDPLRVAARGQRPQSAIGSGSSLGTDGEAAAALWRLAGSAAARRPPWKARRSREL